MHHQSDIFKAVVDDAKEAFYTLPLKDPLFPSSSEKESNDGGLVSCLVGDLKQIAYGSVVKLCRRKKMVNGKQFHNWGKNERGGRKTKMIRCMSLRTPERRMPLRTLKRRIETRNPILLPTKNLQGTVFLMYIFVFLFLSISSLMNSSNI